MHWHSIRYLYDKNEPVDNVYCRICKTRSQPTHYANTELSQDAERGTYSRCNIALKLSCGHIVVDDCDSDDHNGMTFPSETEWRREILSGHKSP